MVFLLTADFPIFVLIFNKVFTFRAAPQHICIFLLRLFQNICCYLPFLWIINIAGVIYLRAVKLFVIRRFAFTNCCTNS
eukprot:UN21185